MTATEGIPGSDDAARVYSQHYAELTRLLRRLCGDAALAEDLAQEAGLRLVTAMRRESIAQPRAFLFHVAANLARDQLRRRLIAQEHASRQEEWEQAPGTDHIASLRQEVAFVAKAVAELPPRAREVLQLARIEGYSQKEIAAQLGIAPKTVENHLTRALAQLATRWRRGAHQ